MVLALELIAAPTQPLQEELTAFVLCQRSVADKAEDFVLPKTPLRGTNPR